MVAKGVVLAALLAAAMAPAVVEARAGFSVHVLRHGHLVELNAWPEREAREWDHDRIRIVVGDVREDMIREVVSDVRRDVARIRSDVAPLRDPDGWVLRDVRVVRDDHAEVRDAVERVRRRIRELKERLEAEGWR